MTWNTELDLAKKDQDKFIRRGRKIVKRYRDERDNIGGMSAAKRYNILWSNTQTLTAATYARKPKAQAERRNKDRDPVGRTAAQILERALQYEIDHYPFFDAALRNAVKDRFLPGRGVAWVRLEPGSQISEDETIGQYECCPEDYVYWEDFRHSPARTWEEVTWVARLVYMGEEEGKARFGDEFKNAPMSHEPIGIEKGSVGSDYDRMKKAKVWEIWDKSTMKAIWWAEGTTNTLDEKEDPLQLDGFFPCPKPLFATQTTDTVNPVADFAQYQDQAQELDELTQRIGMLTKAVKVVGVYDAGQDGVKRMLSEGVDNTLIPVTTWAQFGEKGGLKGVVDFLPLDMVIKALNELYIARESCKQVIYDVTGISDIVRGASNATETATAQQIKSQYANLRLKESTNDVARFASDILNIKAQIMCKFYRPQTLIEMSGIMETDDAQFAEEAVQLLASDQIRNYRIEVASDSMVELDEQAERQSRVEFLTAAGGFLDKAVQGGMAVPEIAPLLGEMLMFGVRSFKAGRPVEAAFEQAMAALAKPKEPKPDPEQMKLQAQQQADQQKLQADMQAEQMRAQMDAQIEAQRLQQEAMFEERRIAMEQCANEQKLMMEGQMQMMQERFDRWKAELDAAVKIEAANIAAKSKVADAATETATNEIASEVRQ
jgi:hypothetical protein